MEVTQTGSQLSPSDLDAVEERLGISLPGDLRDLYLRANGGIPVPDSFEKDGEYYTVQCLLPMSGPGSGFEQSFKTLILDNEDYPDDVIPFADDPSGDVFVYSMSPKTLGQIQLLSGEDYDDPERFVVHLAPSLGEFLNSLVKHPDD